MVTNPKDLTIHKKFFRDYNSDKMDIDTYMRLRKNIITRLPF
jgi:hypothetical protein